MVRTLYVGKLSSSRFQQIHSAPFTHIMVLAASDAPALAQSTIHCGNTGTVLTKDWPADWPHWAPNGQPA
eukprot:scaffold8225_cov129-Isochrysis_galbana.AAC.2